MAALTARSLKTRWPASESRPTHPFVLIMSSSGRSSCANVSRHPQMSPYFQQRRANIGRALLLLPSVAAAIRDSDGRLLLQEKASGKGY